MGYTTAACPPGPSGETKKKKKQADSCRETQGDQVFWRQLSQKTDGEVGWGRVNVKRGRSACGNVHCHQCRRLRRAANDSHIKTVITALAVLFTTQPQRSTCVCVSCWCSPSVKFGSAYQQNKCWTCTFLQNVHIKTQFKCMFQFQLDAVTSLCLNKRTRQNV